MDIVPVVFRLFSSYTRLNQLDRTSCLDLQKLCWLPLQDTFTLNVRPALERLTSLSLMTTDFPWQSSSENKVRPILLTSILFILIRCKWDKGWTEDYECLNLTKSECLYWWNISQLSHLELLTPSGRGMSGSRDQQGRIICIICIFGAILYNINYPLNNLKIYWVLNTYFLVKFLKIYRVKQKQNRNKQIK